MKKLTLMMLSLLMAHNAQAESGPLVLGLLAGTTVPLMLGYETSATLTRCHVQADGNVEIFFPRKYSRLIGGGISSLVTALSLLAINTPAVKDPAAAGFLCGTFISSLLFSFFNLKVDINELRGNEAELLSGNPLFPVEYKNNNGHWIRPHKDKVSYKASFKEVALNFKKACGDFITTAATATAFTLGGIY